MGKFKDKLKQISADSIENRGASSVRLLKALMKKAAEGNRSHINVYSRLTDEAVEWLKYEGFSLIDTSFSSAVRCTGPQYRIEWEN